MQIFADWTSKIQFKVMFTEVKAKLKHILQLLKGHLSKNNFLELCFSSVKYKLLCVFGAVYVTKQAIWRL